MPATAVGEKFALCWSAPQDGSLEVVMNRDTMSRLWREAATHGWLPAARFGEAGVTVTKLKAAYNLGGTSPFERCSALSASLS